MNIAGKTKRVTIVGGGYAGSALARALDGVAEVQLIEPRERFIHNVAAIRAIVDPTLLDRIALPYDRMLRRGVVRRASAASVSECGVELTDGSSIESDIVVVATGSHYARPFKPHEPETLAFFNDSRSAHEAVKEASRIAIIGGGPVGVELAGEIVSRYPRTVVTLVTALPSLLDGFSPRLSEALVKQMQARGIVLRLSTKIHNLTETLAPFSGSLETNGAPVEADLVFPVIGAKPVNDLLRALPGAQIDNTGRVKVDAWLRPAGASRIFALGDAAATGDPMTIVGLSRQVPWLAKTIKGLFQGKRLEDAPAYAPWKTGVIIVPFGLTGGASVLPLTRKGVVLGQRTTAALKGKHLFIPRYRKEFGLDTKG